MRIRLRELREAVRPKLTQSVLADALGSSKSHIAGMESGARNPSAPMLEKIAAYFGVSVPELYDDGDEHARKLRELTAAAEGLSESDFEALLLTARAMRARLPRAQD